MRDAEGLPILHFLQCYLHVGLQRFVLSDHFKSANVPELVNSCLNGGTIAPYPVVWVIQVKMVEHVFAGFVKVVGTALLTSLRLRSEKQRPARTNNCKQGGHFGTVNGVAAKLRSFALQRNVKREDK